MSLSAIILGVINIAIVAAVLVLVGLLVMWLMSAFGWPIPENIQRIYLLIVALVCLYMAAALLFGLPTVGPIIRGWLPDRTMLPMLA